MNWLRCVTHNHCFAMFFAAYSFSTKNNYNKSYKKMSKNKCIFGLPQIKTCVVDSVIQTKLKIPWLILQFDSVSVLNNEWLSSKLGLDSVVTLICGHKYYPVKLIQWYTLQFLTTQLFPVTCQSLQLFSCWFWQKISEFSHTNIYRHCADGAPGPRSEQQDQL